MSPVFSQHSFFDLYEQTAVNSPCSACFLPPTSPPSYPFMPTLVVSAPAPAPAVFVMSCVPRREKVIKRAQSVRKTGSYG